MNSKEKLLIITGISPTPKDSGGAVRIYNTIKCLSEKYDIFLVYFTNDETKNNEEEKFYKKYTKQNYPIIINPEKDKKSFIINFQPYWFSNWYNEEAKILISNLIKNEKINKVQIEFTQLLYLINTVPQNIEKIFTAHDISTISFYRRLKEEKNIKKIIVYFIRLIEIYFYEKKYLSKFNTIYSVSKKDKQLLKKIFKLKNVINIDNGIEEVNFLKRENNKNINLGCIGSFSHPPNKYAFNYFLNKIAPMLESEDINYNFYLAGKNNSEEVKNIIQKSKIKNKEKIIDLGFVNESKDFFKKIDILITPIFSGSGSRIKILEALGFGKKIISSPIGAEGIDLKTNLISISNTPQEYVKEIKDFLKNENKINLEQEKENISKLTWEYIFKHI